jgi:hypothetical protein
MAGDHVPITTNDEHNAQRKPEMIEINHFVFSSICLRRGPEVE